MHDFNDRANVGRAALSMDRDLGISASGLRAAVTPMIMGLTKNVTGTLAASMTAMAGA